jgi:hypothetical protein
MLVATGHGSASGKTLKGSGVDYTEVRCGNLDSLVFWLPAEYWTVRGRKEARCR